MPHPTILLVEDQKSSVLFFEHTMERLGITHPLKVARDGQEALDYLEGAGVFADRTMYPMPGLVIMDLEMPFFTGLEVLERVRRNPELRKLIVIMFTSSSSEWDINRAYELGANAYLVKPAGLAGLSEAVRAIHQFWLLLNRAPEVHGTCAMRAG